MAKRIELHREIPAEDHDAHSHVGYAHSYDSEGMPAGHEHMIMHDHAHGHTHNHTQTKAVLNRMARLIGHLESIRKMVENGRDCSEVLIQLAAVDSAIKGVSRVILKDHLEHCIVDAAKSDDKAAIHAVGKAIDQFMK